MHRGKFAGGRGLGLSVAIGAGLVIALGSRVQAQAAGARSASDSPCSAIEKSVPEGKGLARPVVVPSLRTWSEQPGSWSVDADSRIIVETSAAGARAIAEQFARELQGFTGKTFKVVAGEKAHLHDIVFSQRVCSQAVAQAVGREGYSLLIGGPILVRANGTSGLRYATTTLLQMIALAKNDHRVPIVLRDGFTVDAPAFSVRSVMLDVGRLYMRPQFLEAFMRWMGWYKLNTLELHLNDQAFGIDKSGSAIDPENPTYYSRSMRLLSPRFPLAAPTDGTPGATTSEGKKGYDRADWEQMEAAARENGITLKPEIDIPAHSGPFLNARPDLELKGVSPQWGGMFDLSKPESLQFANQIFDEYLPWFHSNAISIGGDEAAPERTGVSDQVRAQFLAGVIQHILANGNASGDRRTVTMWNDAFAENSALTPLRGSIVIQNWLGKADDSLADTHLHGVVDSRSDWYLVPTKNTDTNQELAKKIYDEWVLDPRSLGGQICEWNDNAVLGLNETGVWNATKDVLPVEAEVVWDGRKHAAGETASTYAEFAAKLQRLGAVTGATKAILPSPAPKQ